MTINDTNELRRILFANFYWAYTVTVSSAYEKNQSIRLSIAGTRGLPVIRLRARVTEVEKLSSSYFDWADLFTLLKIVI